MDILKRLLTITTLLSIALMGLRLVYKPPLPALTHLKTEVTSREPHQSEIWSESIRLNYHNFTYVLTPVADYEIYGLVVAEHSSRVWWDVYHKRDPANTKDVCVVWGKNITSGAYQKVTYSHGDFTCYYRWSKPFDPPFDPTFIANNHLIPASRTIENMINKVHVGDQIRLSGKLVNYEVTDAHGQTVSSRLTSTTRNDTNNGACEVIYTQDLTILERDSHWLRTLYRMITPVFWGGGLIRLLLIFV